MNLKRMIALLLAAATLCALLVFPAAAASGDRPFTDISDPAVAEAAELLRLLGVVNGVGGTSFHPSGTLTRASFCKMALEVAGRGKEAGAQANRVVFPDVGASHWALGYVNAAAGIPAGGGEPLVRGKGDGRFWPDESITFAQAVTILMRLLGYTDTDVGAGAMWYDGYLSHAAQAGLTDGVPKAGTAVLSRGEAAILFQNLLFTEKKDSDALYLTTMGASLTENAIVLNTNATADDGTTGSVETTLGTYKTDRGSFPATLAGTRGKLLLNKDGKLLAVRPQTSDTLRRVSVLDAQPNRVTAAGGEKLSVDLDTVVWKDGSSSTYEHAWAGLRVGTSLVFCYNGAGKVDYVFIATAAAGQSGQRAMVAKNRPNGTTNPFATLIGAWETGYTIYKNGASATVADIRQYDVATYDSAAKVLHVSDARLTGAYENAYPNAAAPSKVTVMGQDFDVLASAISDLASFKIGDQITLLFASDYQVAGVVSSSTVKSTAVGLASISGGTASVTLLGSGLTVTGKISLSEDTVKALNGNLVTVSSGRVGYLSLSKLSGSSTNASLNVPAGTLGTRALAENAVIYETVGSSALRQLRLEDISLATVPASKVQFVRYDYADRVQYLVLDDVTGDAYQYGYFVYVDAINEPIYKYNDDGSPTSEIVGHDTTPAQVQIRYANSSGTETITPQAACFFSVRSGAPGGLAFGGAGQLANHVTLTMLSGLRRTSFDLDGEEMTLTTSSAVYTVWEEVQCYNKTTERWYTPGEDGLAAALAFSDSITAYFDRSPEEGGKIRLVEVR
ncbi:MAG: S-layer homology domain-containing protein [Clostridiales bacterium]|nr:S-layer homology domain-containing protein [Clostridiales bacterium]